MTSSAEPPSNGTKAEHRLTAIEAGLSHFREIQEMRQQHTDRAICDLRKHNRRQDEAQEVLEERMLARITEIRDLLWSAMKWLGAGLASTILMIVLKASGLV